MYCTLGGNFFHFSILISFQEYYEKKKMKDRIKYIILKENDI